MGTNHNHITRDVKRIGECPGCDAGYKARGGQTAYEDLFEELELAMKALREVQTVSKVAQVYRVEDAAKALSENAWRRYFANRIREDILANEGLTDPTQFQIHEALVRLADDIEEGRL